METSKKDDYSGVAKKVSELLKDGVGMVEIINSIRANFSILNESRENIVLKKTNK